jgi:hypothetical protein
MTHMECYGRLKNETKNACYQGAIALVSTDIPLQNTMMLKGFMVSTAREHFENLYLLTVAVLLRMKRDLVDKKHLITEYMLNRVKNRRQNLS